MSAEPTTTMQAYADAYGEPDPQTSERLAQHLEQLIADEERGGPTLRRRRLLYLIGSLLVVAAVSVALGRWWAMDRDDTVLGSNVATRVQLAGGDVQLDPGARVRVLYDEGRSVIELRAGTIEIEGRDRPGGVQVLSGRYTVDSLGAHLRIEATAGLPVVHVLDGKAIVRGPDLPDAGVTLVP